MGSFDLNIIIELSILKLDLVPIFIFKRQIGFVWTKFTQKGYLRSRTEKVDISMKFNKLNYQARYQISS